MRAIARELMAIAKQLSVEGDFPVVTLYHGTFLMNLPYIKKSGLTPRTVDAKVIVSKALKQVAEAYQMTPEQENELEKSPAVRTAIGRIEQSGFDKIYLSGEKSYAEGHVGAGGEWLEFLVMAAEKIAHREFHELDHDYAMQLLGLQHQMKENDEELRDLMVQSDTEEWSRKNSFFRKTDVEYYRLSKEREEVLSSKRAELKAQRKKAVEAQYGDRGVLLTVKMPYPVFVRKLASARSKGRVKEFESQYMSWKDGDDQTWFGFVNGRSDKIWEFFREVHLSSVESKYIVSSKVV